MAVGRRVVRTGSPTKRSNSPTVLASSVNDVKKKKKPRSESPPGVALVPQSAPPPPPVVTSSSASPRTRTSRKTRRTPTATGPSSDRVREQTREQQRQRADAAKSRPHATLHSLLSSASPRSTSPRDPTIKREPEENVMQLTPRLDLNKLTPTVDIPEVAPSEESGPESPSPECYFVSGDGKKILSDVSCTTPRSMALRTSTMSLTEAAVAAGLVEDTTPSTPKAKSARESLPKKKPSTTKPRISTASSNATPAKKQQRSGSTTRKTPTAATPAKRSGTVPTIVSRKGKPITTPQTTKEIPRSEAESVSQTFTRSVSEVQKVEEKVEEEKPNPLGVIPENKPIAKKKSASVLRKTPQTTPASSPRKKAKGKGKYRPGQVIIPPQREEWQDVYTVVLDMDETLLWHPALGEVYERPGAKDLLKGLKGRCEVVLWTASTRAVTEVALGVLGIRPSDFTHIITRDDRWFSWKRSTKDIRFLGRSPDHVVVVENSPYSIQLNKQNGILVADFNTRHAARDDTLFRVDKILQGLISSKRPVPEYLEESQGIVSNHFRLFANSPLSSFYCVG